MQPIDTEESNHNFGPPIGLEDAIGDLPCKREDVPELGGTFYYSVWEPSMSERAAIASGQNIRLGVGWTGAFPPVSLGVTHLTRRGGENMEEEKQNPPSEEESQATSDTSTDAPAPAEGEQSGPETGDPATDPDGTDAADAADGDEE